MNSFNNIITSSAWRLVLALLAVFVLVSCGGGGGGGSGGNSTTGGTVAVQGVLALPTGDSATQYTVFNSNQGSTPSSTGSFSTVIAKDSPTYTYAVSDTGNKVYASVNTGADGSVTINSQSTAEAMVLLNPLLIPRTSIERTQIINIVKADAAVKSLATVIESVYGSVSDPMSDTRISDALTSAVSSVLSSWQALKNSPASALAFRQATQKGFLLGLASCGTFCGSSPLQIINNDMGALTLANSSGSTLKLELNNVGIGGITTNIDWVVRIVELDPTKIQWTQYGGVQLQNPTLIDVDSLIKSGGYDQKTLIEGAVGSGLLKFIVDPIGNVASNFGDLVFPDSGIILPHDGVYAVIALSGSPYGDAAEYSSVQSSVWQASYSAEAASINIGSAAIDVIGVGTTFVNAATGVDIDISPVLQLELGAIKTELTNNPGYISSTYFVGKIADLTDKLLDFLKPYINSSISNLQVTGWKKFFHIAVNTATSVVNVWSGTVSASTRVANYIYNVTPRESGYAILGTYTVTPDTTPPSVPTGLTSTVISSSQINLTWSASTDDVGVAGYNIYRDGSLLASQATLSYGDTGLSPSTQYCYTVSAFDAAENVSVQNSPQCSTTLALPTAPTGISATAGDSQATISWHAVTGVTYNLYMASVSGVTKSNYSSLADGKQHIGVTSPFIQTGLTNGTAYYFVVTAVDANGESVESSQVSATPVAVAVSTSKLNDTGITSSQCYQAGSDVLVDCGSAGAIALNNAQDGMVGLDANPTTNSNSDGKLGFSFTNFTGGCVQDNVTGLMWEVKTTDGGLRDWNKTYTNYSTSYDPNLQYGTATDASGFVSAVNATNLCGYSDWRLPAADELQSIVDYGVASPGPAIDTSRFPNTKTGGWYLTSSPFDNSSSLAWVVDFAAGNLSGDSNSTSHSVRLVRGASFQTSPRYTVSVDGMEVTDNKTKLIWRICAESMNSAGSGCGGIPSTYNHEQALQAAAVQSSNTGLAWRLPNVKELFSLAGNGFSNTLGGINTFPSVSSAGLYWSASPNVGILGNAWSVSFGNGWIYSSVSGYAGRSSYSGYVRLVRDAP